MLDSPIQDIKDRLPILELIQDFVQLKKAGTNYKGLCPFHSEKTPSFMVSPSKQIWHCFGCSMGGDIFEFVKLMENVEFPEALKILADRAGVELRKPTPEQVQLGEKKNVLFEINTAAAKYFAKVLWESESAKEALEYLRTRGLTDQTIKNWQLGWAPDDFHYLENFLAKGFKKDDVVLAGLIVKKDDGAYFDRFRGRVMFPIQNVHGQIVGFTGRLLHERPDTGLPADARRWQAGKYVNSPETPIYSKSKLIYGLHQARNTIRKEDRVIIVEGNMDVITSHQAGLTQTVATSGTAFTSDQLRELAKFTKNLIFSLDNDNAGAAATQKALELALSFGFNVKIAELGESKDPDELIKKGIGIWNKIVDGALHYIDFSLNQVIKEFDPRTPEGVQAIQSRIIKLINYLGNSVVRAHFVRELADRLNVNEQSIFDELKKLSVPKIEELKQKTAVKKTRLEWLQERFLGLSIKLKDKSELAGFAPEDFGRYKDVYTAIYTSSNVPDLTQTLDLLEFAVQTEIEEQGLDAKSELKNSAVELKRALFKQQMEKLSEQLKLAEQKSDRDLVKKLSSEYVVLTHKIGQLKN